jgi:hypothetical protein
MRRLPWGAFRSGGWSDGRCRRLAATHRGVIAGAAWVGGKVSDSPKRYAGLLAPYRRSTWPPYQFFGDHRWKEAISLQ